MITTKLRTSINKTIITNKTKLPNILNTKTKSLLYSNPRFLHQNYYHPNDVPIYQTPSLGHKEGTTPKVDPENFVYPASNIIQREDPEHKNYVSKEQDYKSAAIDQDPEMFLPEEPTFLEFWGVYPFALFAASFLISKEFFILYGCGMNTILLAVPVSIFFIGLIQLGGKLVLEDKQFDNDQVWMAFIMNRWGLKNGINNYEKYLRIKEYSEKLGKYLKNLTSYKVAYFAHKRQQKSIEKTLNILKKAKATEDFLKEKLKDLAKNQLEETKAKFYETDFSEKWHKKLFENLEETSKFDFKDNLERPDVKKAFEKSVKENEELEKEKMNKIVKPYGIYKQYLAKLLNVWNSLDVVSKRKMPEKIRISDYVDNNVKMTAEQSAEIEQRMIQIVKKQIARFKPEKVPEELKTMLKKLESKHC